MDCDHKVTFPARKSKSKAKARTEVMVAMGEMQRKATHFAAGCVFVHLWTSMYIYIYFFWKGDCLGVIAKN